MLPSEFDLEANDCYVGLGEVEDAYATLLERQVSFDSFLKHFSSLVRKHHFEKWLGVFLLHRHFDLEPGEIMLERQAMVDGERSLVTAPTRAADATDCVPTRWAVRAGTLVPLEFSLDEGARDGFAEIAEASDFGKDFCGLISDCGVADFVGLAVVERYFVTAGPTENYIERNFLDGSVVTVLPTRELAADTIPTTWSVDLSSEASPVAPQMRCMSLCTQRQGPTRDSPTRHERTGHMPIN